MSSLAVPTQRPVPASVFGLWLQLCLIRRPNMGLIKTVTIAVVAFAPVDAIQESSVPLGFSALTVLSVLFFVVSFLDAHTQI